MTRDDEGRQRLERHQELDRRSVLGQTIGAGLAGALLSGFGSFGGDLMAAGQAGATEIPGIALPKGVRRIITGHNAQGRSYIIKDDRVITGPFPSLYKATGEMPL